MRIKSKRDFYELAAKGLCGNTMRTWGSVGEFLGDPYRPGEVGIRQTSVGTAGWPRVPAKRVSWLIRKNGLKSGGYVISEIPPTIAAEGYRLQGEMTWGVYRDGPSRPYRYPGGFCMGVRDDSGVSHAGWVLYYTHNMGYMRARLRESGRHAFGLTAINLLRQYTTASEYRAFMELFDRYTDHESGEYPTIEFACMAVPMGRFNQQLVIWEIRNGY